jgi:hypothetical protein
MEFLTYRKFNEHTAAKTFSLLLEDEGITNVLEDSSPKFDPGFSNNELLKEFRIKISSEDFEKADVILLKQATDLADEIDENHYLFQYNNDELKEVLSKADEWNEIDIALARKILEKRGIVFSQSDLKELHKKRLFELSKPEHFSETWIRFAYIVSIAGGLIGLVIGWHINTHKKTLPNGESVFAYDEISRKKGNNIFKVGIFMLVLWIVIFVLRSIFFDQGYYEVDQRNIFGN